MKSMLDFNNGYVTIELSPFQCATLAKACHFASEQSYEADIDAWRTLAALFHACTIVGYAQWHMCGPDLEALLEQLDLLHLRRNSDDNKSNLNGEQP